MAKYLGPSSPYTAVANPDMAVRSCGGFLLPLPGIKCQSSSIAKGSNSSCVVLVAVAAAAVVVVVSTIIISECVN